MDMSEDRSRPSTRAPAGRAAWSGMVLAGALALAGTALVLVLTGTSATGLSLPAYVSATPRATPPPTTPTTAPTTTTLPVIRRAVTRGTTTYITTLPKVSVEDDNGRVLDDRGHHDDPPGPPPKGDS